MMHAMGLHSALAIKRQRKRREEQKRARERRFSSQSTESGLGESRSSFASPRTSMTSLEKRRRKKKVPAKIVSTDSKVASSMGMLHIGVVFIVLGLFLLGSAVIPDDFDTWEYHNMERVYEFICSGLACFLIGLFLIGVNKIITGKEERDLSDYIERQLTRSRSGHRLVRDSETGGLSSSRPPKSPMRESMEFESELPNGTTPRSPPPISVTTPKSDLERILEEEIEAKHERKIEKHNSNMKYYTSMPICD